MRNPFARRRDRRVAAEHITLTDWNSGRVDSLTPISFPDALSPIPHGIRVRDRDGRELRELVSSVVEGLADENALDAHTVDALQHWIRDLHSTWVGEVCRDSDARRTTAARLVAVDRDNLRREHAELAAVERRRIEALRLRGALLAEAGFPELVVDEQREPAELEPSLVEQRLSSQHPASTDTAGGTE